VKTGVPQAARAEQVRLLGGEGGWNDPDAGGHAMRPVEVHDAVDGLGRTAREAVRLGGP
jgi:hypothetical protein